MAYDRILFEAVTAIGEVSELWGNVYSPRAQEVIFVSFFLRPAALKMLAVALLRLRFLPCRPQK
jgi:hypothetical protein